jgi:hypothetical protein
MSIRVNLPAGATSMRVRLETSTLGKLLIKGSPSYVEVLSFGTMHYNRELFSSAFVTPVSV